MSAPTPAQACMEAHRILGLAALRADAPRDRLETGLRRLVLEVLALRMAVDRRVLPDDLVRPAQALLAGERIDWGTLAGLFAGLAARRATDPGSPSAGAEEVWPLNEYIPSTALSQATLSIGLLAGQIPVRALGDAFQTLLEAPLPAADDRQDRRRLRERRRRGGLFFTPQRIVERMAALAAPRPRRGPAAPYVCDPAMGTGHFLIALGRRLARDDLRAARRLADQRIYGVERDPEVARLARTSLWLAFSSPIVPFVPPAAHFPCTDALVGATWEEHPSEHAARERAGLTGLDWHAAFPEVAARGGFDVVIANPPYDVLTGFRSNPDLAAYARYLRECGQYRDSLGGQLNLYRLFVERSLALARPGGRVVLIVPAGMLTDRTAAALRRRLIHTHGLQSVEHFAESEREFAGVGQAVVILTARRDHGRAARIRMRATVEGDHGPRRTDQRIDTRLVDKLDPRSASLPVAEPKDWRVVRWLARRATARFADLAEGMVGEVDQTVYRAHMRDRGGVLLVRGAHLRPFRVDLASAPGTARFLDEAGFLAQKGDAAPACRARVYRTRVLQLGIRNMESRPRLVAARVRAGVYTGNSVNVWIPRQGVPEALVVGLLNSALYDWRFRLTSSNNNINLYEVEALPMPADLIQHLTATGEPTPAARRRWARRLQAVDTAVVAAERSAEQDTDLAQARADLDRAVYDLFGLPQSLRALLPGPGRRQPGR